MEEKKSRSRSRLAPKVSTSRSEIIKREPYVFLLQIIPPTIDKDKITDAKNVKELELRIGTKGKLSTTSITARNLKGVA